ncbi:MAG TPA: glycosyltransferase [Chthoniobacterales bacterium]
MKIVIFGLTLTSSWGNGHATLWRGLCRALIAGGHDVTFLEKDVPYYAETRDLWEMDGLRLMLYREWDEIRESVLRELHEADAAIVTSYCADGIPAAQMLREQDGLVRLFYDMDTPVTLANLRSGQELAYIGSRGLSDYDVVMSFTGGGVLDELRDRLGARHVRTLYGWVDPDIHQPSVPREEFLGEMSYLGTFAADRQDALEELFLETARTQQHRRFMLAGAQYPAEFPWSGNVYFVRHLPPEDHAAFLCSSKFTLNVTRLPMRENGWCPSGRLFEAAACGVPIISDVWEGLDHFFQPGKEILTAATSADVVAALETGADERLRIARAARDRVLSEHTAAHRAKELLSIIAEAKEAAAQAV